MNDCVKAVCGENIMVIEINEELYALVNGDNVLFARYPDSFYKQGYFREPDHVSDRDLRMALRAIRDVSERMKPDSAWRNCLGRLDGEEVKRSCKKFLESI